METDASLPIPVNRTPVLTLLATVVAERLGHPPDIALTLGGAVCSASARTKARPLGITDEAQEVAERRAAAAGSKLGVQRFGSSVARYPSWRWLAVRIGGWRRQAGIVQEREDLHRESIRRSTCGGQGRHGGGSGVSAARRTEPGLLPAL